MTLDDCIHRYMETLEIDELEDYLEKMPRNRDGFEELTDAISSYDIQILYHVLFEEYLHLLSADEAFEYLEKYARTFDLDPDQIEAINELRTDMIDISTGTYLDCLSDEDEDEMSASEIEECVSQLLDDSEICDDGDHVFLAVNQDGEQVECERLFTFEYGDKEYMVYTDNSKDEDGKVRIFAAIYKDNNLSPIETDKEWAIIEAILNEIQRRLGNN